MVFWSKRWHQKDISKLTNLYISLCEYFELLSFQGVPPHYKLLPQISKPIYFSVIELQKVSRWQKFGNCFAVFDKKYHLVQHNNLIILVALKPQIAIFHTKVDFNDLWKTNECPCYIFRTELIFWTIFWYLDDCA